MKRKVWVWNHYASDTYFDKGGRHYNFVKYLKQSGYEPVVFASNAKHGKAGTYFPDAGLWQEHMAEEIGVPFVFVRSRTYEGNGKQRVLNMIDFYRNVKKTAREYAKQYGKPDIIYASSVHPLTLVAGIQTAKHFGVKCICEVRDLWPESIVAYSSKLTKRNPLIRLLYQGEKWIYQKADALIFTMEGAYDYIVERGWEKKIPRSKVHYINNGVDLEVFQYNRANFQVKDPDLQNPDIFKVLYTGSIRRVNNLGLLLDAAKKVTDPKIKFLIWGDGDERAALELRLQNEGISNVVFKGKVEKKYIPYIVSQANLNLVHWEQSDLLRFGESYNKLFEYLAAGAPIFSTVQTGYSIVKGNYCGLESQGDTPGDFAAGIRQIAALSENERQIMGKNALKAAEKYDFQSLTRQLINIIEG